MKILGFYISRRRSPVVVNTYRVMKTDAQKLRDAKTRQLAAEVGVSDDLASKLFPDRADRRRVEESF